MKRIKFVNSKKLIVLAATALIVSGCNDRKVADNDRGVTFTRNVQVSLLEPDDHFTKALDAFADQHYYRSYQQIQKGIHYLEGVSSASKGVYKKEVDNSIDELMELSDLVRYDKVDGINELNYFFARTGRVLGDNHTMIVENLIPSSKANPDGYTLAIDVKNLDKPDSQKVIAYREEESQLLSDARNLARKMHAKYDLNNQTVSTAMASLKTGLTQIG